MTAQTVLVWGKPHTVEVYQKSKGVWIAVGDYMGERIEVEALAHWRETARYRGN